MKKAIFGSLFLVLASFGQTPGTRTVVLTWEDTRNPSIGTTYNIYRAPGLCSGTPVFAKMVTGVTGKTYSDLNVAVGNYCYVATASFNNLESAQSNTAPKTVPPFEPTVLTADVKVN